MTLTMLASLSQGCVEAVIESDEKGIERQYVIGEPFAVNFFSSLLPHAHIEIDSLKISSTKTIDSPVYLPSMPDGEQGTGEQHETDR
jgi:5-formaminoimidazole-4-carboxamide-1-beta-D-ribofuranosyl 5'-monophosphate synthetase